LAPLDFIGIVVAACCKTGRRRFLGMLGNLVMISRAAIVTPYKTNRLGMPITK